MTIQRQIQLRSQKKRYRNRLQIVQVKTCEFDVLLTNRQFVKVEINENDKLLSKIDTIRGKLSAKTENFLREKSKLDRSARIVFIMNFETFCN